MTFRVLLFRDKRAAERFLRRHRDKVVQVPVIVEEDNNENIFGEAGWRGAVKSKYGAVVLSGLILLQES